MKKYEPKKTAYEVLQYDGENVSEISSLVRVPGACKNAGGLSGLRFGLNGAWRRLHESDWVIRFGDDVYDHIFLSDFEFKRMFKETQ